MSAHMKMLSPAEALSLKLRNLSVHATHCTERPSILTNINLDLMAGQTLIVTGPSGSGKTTLALAILRLLPKEEFRIRGSISLAGRELCALSEVQMRTVRGSQIGLVLQDAHASLNPLLTIGVQIGEALVEHRRCDWKEAQAKGLDTLGRLDFGHPASIWNSRPGRLSGGMKQRVCLAMAMVLAPRVLILDEPTANLDWETREEVLDAVDCVQSSTGCGMIWLTHDERVMERYSHCSARTIRELEEGAVR